MNKIKLIASLMFTISAATAATNSESTDALFMNSNSLTSINKIDKESSKPIIIEGCSSKEQPKPAVKKQYPKRNIAVKNVTKPVGYINNLIFDFNYSGDVSGVPNALRKFDGRINIIQNSGTKSELQINIDLQRVKLQDVIDAINIQTNQKAKLIYLQDNNSIYILYANNFNVGQNAVDESLKWQKGIAPKPVLRRDGVVRFPFGEYQPEVICQPQQLCDIELQTGEDINGIAIGDSVNWNEEDKGLPVIYSGTSGNLTPHLVLKPNRGGLDTSLMVTTSRRTYMLKLKSALNGYVARVGFYYPNEMIQRYENNKQDIRNQGNNEAVGVSKTPQGITVDLSKINSKYTIDGDNYSWKPTQVYDDGTHVYIQMPVDVDARSLPGLCVIPDGDDTETKCQYVNWKYDNHIYIIDELFNKVLLMNGYGDYQQTITITKNPDKPGFWARLFGG